MEWIRREGGNRVLDRLNISTTCCSEESQM